MDEAALTRDQDVVAQVLIEIFSAWRETFLSPEDSLAKTAQRSIAFFCFTSRL